MGSNPTLSAKNEFMKKKIAIITGVLGQDGSYLAKLLSDKKYTVIGIERFNSQKQYWRHDFLNIKNKIIYENADLNDEFALGKLIQKYKPNEFYNLASHSFVKSSFDQPLNVIDTNAKSVIRILENIKKFSPNTKFYQASTSEMYGGQSKKKLDINSNFNPRSPYAYSKLLAHFATKNYREADKLFACSGILFNHESVLRGEEFVTKKIIKSLVDYKLDKNNYKKVSLGNVNSTRDWGYAGEYVYGMWKILQMKKPNDYVIGTGKHISVRSFINYSMNYLGLNNFIWVGKGLKEKLIFNKDVIFDIDPKFFRKTEVDRLQCNVNETYKKLKWKPKIFHKKLIKNMIDEEILLRSL